MSSMGCFREHRLHVFRLALGIRVSIELVFLGERALEIFIPPRICRVRPQVVSKQDMVPEEATRGLDHMEMVPS